VTLRRAYSSKVRILVGPPSNQALRVIRSAFFVKPAPHGDRSVTVYAPLLSQLAGWSLHILGRPLRGAPACVDPTPDVALVPASAAADLVPGRECVLVHFAVDVALLHPGPGFDLLELQQDFGDVLSCAHLEPPLLQWWVPTAAQCANPIAPWTQGLRSMSGPWWGCPV
jgi:hypothetical protein